MIKLNKTIKEEKKKVVDCPFEDAIKQSEISKKNREEVMKERTIENNPVSDIDATIKASKIEAPKKNKFNVVESFLKEGYNYSVDNNMFTVNVVDRKALGKLADYLKENKVNYLIKRSVVEGFRYDVTIGQNSKVKSLKEGISADRADVYTRFKDALIGVEKAIAEWCEVFEIDDFAYDTANELFNTLGLDKYFSMSLDEYEPFLDDCVYKIEDMISEEKVLTKEEFATWHDAQKDDKGYAKIDRIYKIFKDAGSSEEEDVDVSYDKLSDEDKIKVTKIVNEDAIKQSEISKKNRKEVNLWDSLETDKGIKHNPEEKKVFALDLREGGVWKHINLINISDKDKNEVERFKNTLRDKGIYFEPSSDGNYVHFEVSCKSDDDVKFVDDYLRGVGINSYREEEHKEVCPKCGKEPCVCEKMIYLGSNRPVNEELKLIMTLDDYEPWSGAVDLWEEIQEADKVDELEFMLEDCYPEGLTVTQLNDILWFESDWVREQLGLVDVPEDEEDEEE